EGLREAFTTRNLHGYARRREGRLGATDTDNVQGEPILARSPDSLQDPRGGRDAEVGRERQQEAIRNHREGQVCTDLIPQDKGRNRARVAGRLPPGWTGLPSFSEKSVGQRLTSSTFFSDLRRGKHANCGQVFVIQNPDSRRYLAYKARARRF